MHRIEIPDIRFSKEMPESMEELTRAQFVYFSSLLLLLFEEKITIAELKVRMAMKLLDLDVNPKDYQKLPTKTKLAITENLYRITELTDYYFVEEEGKYKVNLGFTKNFVPSLVSGSFTYYGPENALMDVDFLEYKDASNYFNSYMKDKDEADLNRLVAVLYRPRNLAMRKPPYNPKDVERRARRFSKLDFSIRFAIYIFFMACEEFLRTAEVDIDGSQVSFSLLYEQTMKEKQLAKKQKYPSNTGLAGVAISLASSGVFGPIEKVYRQNLYDVLFLMYKNRIEYLNEIENLK